MFRRARFNIKCLDGEGDSEERIKDSHKAFGAKITVKSSISGDGAGKTGEGSQKARASSQRITDT